jgi:hypothetical protein
MSSMQTTISKIYLNMPEIQLCLYGHEVEFWREIILLILINNSRYNEYGAYTK